jgi:hypothetical protein
VWRGPDAFRYATLDRRKRPVWHCTVCEEIAVLKPGTYCLNCDRCDKDSIIPRGSPRGGKAKPEPVKDERPTEFKSKRRELAGGMKGKT